MALTLADRRTAARRFVRDVFTGPNTTAVHSTMAIMEVIEDLDAFLDTNAAVINLAIRQPHRADFTAAQKAMCVAVLAMKRAGAI